MSERTPASAAPALKGGVSTIFLALLTVCIAAAIAVTMGRGGVFGVFVFVFAGWFVSLCLHEFGHAVTAWLGGDKAVAELGYLTLNPLRYANPLLSIVVPLMFLAAGGFGFPGGAVYVNTAALRTKTWRALVSAAGPAMNLLCLVIIAIALRFTHPGAPIASALAFLGFAQATAVLLNLLPIPGLDGFGILESILPENERAAFAPIKSGIWILFLLVMLGAPQLLDPVWRVAVRLCGLFGLGQDAIETGAGLFAFWDT